MMIRGFIIHIIQILFLLVDCCYSFLLEDNCQLDIKPCIITNDVLQCGNTGLLLVPKIRANVSSFYFDNNNLTSLEDNAFSCLTNSSRSTSMYLNNNQLYYIANGSFIGIGNTIAILDLSHNNLTTLPQGLGHLQVLDYLNIIGNPITHFDDFAMVNIGHTLTRFDFGSDNITLWPVEFKYLTNLRELKIIDVPLNRLPDDAFHGFEHSLGSLFIINTRLEKIPSAICHLEQLVRLDIENNNYFEERLNPVIQPCVGNKTQVTLIHFTGNDIEKYPNIHDMFDSSTILSIDFSNNSLHIMDLKALQNSPQTSEINLDSNKFVRIPSALNMYTNLRYLYLRNNLIQSVEDYDLFRLEQLEQLHLEHNPLEFISDGAFINNRFLSDLYLSDTKLIRIPSTVLHMPGLRYLAVGGLHIECTCDMMYLNTWNISRISFSWDSKCFLSNENIIHYIQNSLPHCISK